MPMVRAMRLLNAIEAGTLNGAQLQTLLMEDTGRLAEFSVLMGMRGQVRRMAASSTAMTAVIASSTAMTAVIASSTAMAAVAASSTAMTAVIASSTAMTAVIASSTAMTAVAASSTAMAAVAASSTAKMAVFNSDVALNAIAASSIAIEAMRSAAQFSIFNTGTSSSVTSGRALVGPVAGDSYIALGVSTSDATTGATITLSTRHAGSTMSDTKTTASDSVNSAAALDLVVLPMVSPFTARSTDGSNQIIYVGMLRCDV